jgi:COP9 signalosome complex subunit 5
MQQVQDPFLAIVLDPIRTHISGKVDIGGFRVCPEEAHPGWDDGGDIIPEEKIKDFGLNYKQYYKLETSYYMNEKDNELINVRHPILNEKF